MTAVMTWLTKPLMVSCGGRGVSSAVPVPPVPEVGIGRGCGRGDRPDDRLAGTGEIVKESTGAMIGSPAPSSGAIR